MIEPQTPNRRGFIKGIVAGLAGAFFALRGAEPAEAAATSSSPITQVSIATPELIFEISPTDYARINELQSLQNSRELTDEESAELSALYAESDRRSQICEINYSYHSLRSYRSVRLRPGQFAMLVFTYKERDTLRCQLMPHYRLRSGFNPDVDALETSIEQQLLNYETEYGEPYIPLRY